MNPRVKDTPLVRPQFHSLMVAAVEGAYHVIIILYYKFRGDSYMCNIYTSTYIQ